MSKVTFKFRGFTSLLSTFSFLISLVSGIILYFTPQGKIAHWVHWTFWGLDKETWSALHINSSLIFFIIVIFHIYYNWNLLIGYMKKRAKMALNLKAETLTALLISIFIIFASLYNIQPFGTIMKWNEDMKNFWAAKADAEPPIPHAESMTVSEFCEKLNIPIERFENRAKQNNWQILSNNDTIEDIAKRSHIAPAEIYKALQVASGSGNGSGWGRKTVQQVCQELGQDTQKAIAKLRAKQIIAKENSTIRDIANDNQLRPIDVINLMSDKKVQINH